MARIEDYGLIGDLQTAALVGRDGSIDWACFPRFDSGACFAALLGTPEHGRWLLAPRTDAWEGKRQYRPRTLVLETEWETDTGAVRVIDFMPPRGKAPDIVRIVEGLGGHVEMFSELVIRFDYGGTIPWVRRIADGRIAVAGPDALCFRTPVEHRGENLRTLGEFTVRRGERIPFTLTWYPSNERPPRAINAEHALSETVEYWQTWADRCGYTGKWKEECRLARRPEGLTYAPTGGIVAAATTSLPEKIGGERNWDYRYCWLRDATLTLLAFLNAGYLEEARAWRVWLLRAAAGDPSALQIMYGVGGERRLFELELDWLPGYEGSKPVRVGNAAAGQFQLDVYGEVLDALHQARVNKLETSKESMGAAAPAARLSSRSVEGARRRHLGGPRPAPALHALEGDGLGRVRPRRPGVSSASDATGPSNGGARSAPRSTRRSASRASTSSSIPSPSSMARSAWTRAC